EPLSWRSCGDGSARSTGKPGPVAGTPPRTAAGWRAGTPPQEAINTTANTAASLPIYLACQEDLHCSRGPARQLGEGLRAGLEGPRLRKLADAGAAGGELVEGDLEVVPAVGEGAPDRDLAPDHAM